MCNNQFVFLSLATSLILFISCGNQRDTANGFAPSLNLEKATVQKSFPGTQSNLRSTDVYTVHLSGNLPLPTTFDSLLVDDVRIPINELQVDEERATTTLTASGEVGELVIVATRHYYNDEEGAKELEEVQYDKSNRDLGNGGELQYRAGGQHYTLEIEEFSRLDPIKNP